MKAILFLIVAALCGCAGVRHDARVAATAGMRASVESAVGAARDAAHRTAEAKSSLKQAQAKSRALLASVTQEQRPLALELQSSLEVTHAALEGVQESLAKANDALADSSAQVETLQKRISSAETELRQARDTADQMQRGRDFWRACAWKLALLSLALGLWGFRKPILALCSGL